MAARQYKLNNLVLFIDKNGLQSDGATADIMPINFAPAFKAFGWNVIEADGHNLEELLEATKKALLSEDMPSVVIASTVKGKGVSFMENNNAWHHGHLTDDQYHRAMEELSNGNK